MFLHISEEYRLFTDLLSDYGSIGAARPRNHYHQAVNITIGFYLYKIVDIVSTDDKG